MDVPEMPRCPRCHRGADTCKAAGNCGDLVIGNHVDDALRPLYGAVANVETRTGERARIEVTLSPRVYYALAITVLRRGSGPPPPSFEYAPGVVVRRGDR